MANGADTPPPEPAASAPPASAASGGGGKKAGLIALVVVLIAGAGVAGYFIGDSAADAPKAAAEVAALSAA